MKKAVVASMRESSKSSFAIVHRAALRALQAQHGRWPWPSSLSEVSVSETAALLATQDGLGQTTTSTLARHHNALPGPEAFKRALRAF
eukprot:scaffold24499_cov109-Isochrysis_galbana.AAC.4